MKAQTRHSGILILLTLLATQIEAASFTGQVTEATNGSPLAGVMVTVFNEAEEHRQTVYTDAQGRYAIAIPFTGKLRLRARTYAKEDAWQGVSTSDAALKTVDFQMADHESPQALSDSLSASAHLTRLQWPDKAARTTFISQCNYCHQVGNSTTRLPRDHEAWADTIERMEGYGAVLTIDQADTIAKGLHDGFDGQPLEIIHQQHITTALSRAKISEWLVGDGMSFIHDTDVGHDGRLYGTDEGHDLLWVLDRQSGQIKKYPQPDIDLPEGGKFAAMQLPIGIFTGKHGPHSLAQSDDGRFWITNALSSTLMSFNPSTEEYRTYEFKESVLYPHTIRIDQTGIIWFTAAVSNKIVRFDPDTETATVIQLPHNGFFRWLGETMTPHALKFFGRFWPEENLPVTLSPHRWFQGRFMVNLPYGIDVNPIDGSIWYAKLFSNRIGRIDPDTLAIRELDTPLGGPRRPRFDSQGTLWIPAFDDSAVMRFDPDTEEFRSYQLPLLGPNEYETPYALNVHPDTDEVWITSNMSDRILRFNPVTETFIAYPSPTRVTWLRDLVFTRDGQVCSSSSNLPAWAIEDGRPSFICIDPDGGAQDRKLLNESLDVPK